jgi:hypothetical protein
VLKKAGESRQLLLWCVVLPIRVNLFLSCCPETTFAYSASAPSVTFLSLSSINNAPASISFSFSTTNSALTSFSATSSSWASSAPSSSPFSSSKVGRVGCCCGCSSVYDSVNFRVACWGYLRRVLPGPTEMACWYVTSVDAQSADFGAASLCFLQNPRVLALMVQLVCSHPPFAPCLRHTPCDCIQGEYIVTSG